MLRKFVLQTLGKAYKIDTVCFIQAFIRANHFLTHLLRRIRVADCGAESQVAWGGGSRDAGSAVRAVGQVPGRTL